MASAHLESPPLSQSWRPPIDLHGGHVVQQSARRQEISVRHFYPVNRHEVACLCQCTCLCSNICLVERLQGACRRVCLLSVHVAPFSRRTGFCRYPGKRCHVVHCTILFGIFFPHVTFLCCSAQAGLTRVCLHSAGLAHAWVCL